MDGGEGHPITDLTRGASGPVWSPDGKRVAFTASTGPEDNGEKADKGDPEHHKSDVKVITKAVYRANGNPGYVDAEHHAHIFVVSAPASPADKTTPEQITDGEFDERGIEWAPDGSAIYFTSTRVAEPYYRGVALGAVSSGGGRRAH